jgi:aspartate/methionine/tyrosine aminotransferase
MNENVKAEMKKLALVDLCTSVIGQVVMDAAVKPPQIGDPSYELFIKVYFQNKSIY